MELKEFQGLALRTESQIEGIKLNRSNLITLLKVVIEVSEILDGVKKAVFYNKTAKLEGDFTSRLHTLMKLIEALKWQNDGRGPLGTVMDANEAISNVDPRVFHGILGIVTESGELAAALLKSVEDPNYSIDAVNLQEEMSDIAWYEAIIHDHYGLDWGQGLENVINKLRIRYPDKYSDESATIRDLDAERAALEVGVKVAEELGQLSEEELAEDRNYFRRKLARAEARGQNTEKLQKQVAALDDAIIVYRLGRPVQPLKDNPITIDDLVKTQPITKNTGETYQLWNAPAGVNRGNHAVLDDGRFVNLPQEFITGKSFVNIEDDVVQSEVIDGDRRIFYVDIPDCTTPEQLEVIMKELKNRFLHTQTYKVD